jgi:hypothetical protein
VVPVANLPTLSLILAANVPPVSLLSVAWCTLASEYLCKFLKKFEVTLNVIFSGLGEDEIMKKNKIVFMNLNPTDT